MVVSQLRTNEVSDPRVIAAMNAVPREDFVPEERGALAYVDVALPMHRGRRLNAPLVSGRMLVESDVKPGNKVLLIGGGMGYLAAVLDELGAEVVAVEEDADLAAHARKALSNRAHVTVIEGPLSEGYAAQAPYDMLFIDGAVEHIPPSLIDQLRDGAAVEAGLIENGVTRLASARKSGAACALVPYADVEVALLPGFSKPRGFNF